MARPDRKREKRAELLPVLAAAFAELGYRRTTTAELSRRCAVRQNVLYRLWPDKRAMFLAAIGHVFDRSAETWAALLDTPADGSSALQRLIEYESRHHGEFRLYRIVFAGLSETDDPGIRDALRRMYRRFHALLRERIEEQAAAPADGRGGPAADPRLAAWALIGLGTVANIGRELGLVGAPLRRRLFRELAPALAGSDLPGP